MRRAILVMCGFVALAACSTSLAQPLPPHVAIAAQRTDAATSTPPTPANVTAVPVLAPQAVATIDVATLAQTVVTLPQNLHRLETDLLVCAGAIVAVGALNAVLLATLLGRRRATQAAPPPSRDADVAVATPQPIVVELLTARPVDPEATASPPQLAAPRTCDCGASIAARSKTGRCRRCATAVRKPRALALDDARG